MQSEIRKLDDPALLARIMAKQGDWREQLAELLQRHRQSLMTRCYLYLHNQQDAEDAVQETELRVFRAIHGFRQESSFRTWLSAIADRQCHDLARRRARHVLSDHIRELIEIHEEGLRATVDTAEGRDLVRRIMSQMPRRERDILMLRFYVDLPLQDMADSLGIGLSAAKMRLYRALDLFAARMESEQRAA